jgi:hypothetical protein
MKKKTIVSFLLKIEKGTRVRQVLKQLHRLDQIQHS